MLKKFMEKVGEALGIERDMFDPSVLGDPVAMQTDWTPAKKKGGASFKTHKLVEPNSDRLEFRVSTQAKLFYLTFLVVGVGALIGFFCIISFGGRQVNWGTLCLLGAGLAFPPGGGGRFTFALRLSFLTGGAASSGKAERTRITCLTSAP